ncbi:TetR/AcrR family transcriptional regulator [Sphingomonas sp. AX6]|uniref:TetR/AcrR family transcriptional regulator n=1 Tax=Sphingomonas sp. AX6 TaxID=2653171 RepID=UPI00135B53AB|nr:TetR/AcrR family transcriptional regulator [Sphingomonas sp. AX6]
MNDDLNSVKTKPRYHHGALRDALLDAAEAVIGERGLDGFSLRECARRAGVSPAAPAHHFGDARGLLTALAARGFAGLAEAMEHLAPSDDPVADLQAMGAAYVAFAFARPALFDLMWRRPMLDREAPGFLAVADRAFDPLAQAVGRITGTPPDPTDIVAAWSIVHGYARLALDGAVPRDNLPPIEAVVRRLRI